MSLESSSQKLLNGKGRGDGERLCAAEALIHKIK